MIERPGPVDPNGPCANTIPQDDVKLVSLPTGNYSYIFKTHDLIGINQISIKSALNSNSKI